MYYSGGRPSRDAARVPRAIVVVFLVMLHLHLPSGSVKRLKPSPARLEGEHEVVGLWTREITEDDEHLWDTVAFDEEGGFKPVGEAPPSDI